MDKVEADRLRAKRVRAQISDSDFHEASAFFSATQPPIFVPSPFDHDRVVERGLRGMGIVAYCRPFKQSRKGISGQSEAMLDFEDMGAEMTPEFRTLHFQLLELRDQFLAHSDYGDRYVMQTPGPPGGYGISFLSSWPEVLAIDPQQVWRLTLGWNRRCFQLVVEIGEKLKAAGLE